MSLLISDGLEIIDLSAFLGTASPAEVAALAAASIGGGAFVNLFDNSGALGIRLADASDPLKFANGFAPLAISSGAAGLVLGYGLNVNLSISVAGEVWLSDVTPGGFMTSPPTTEGHIIQPLGMAIPGVGIFFMPQMRILL